MDTTAFFGSEKISRILLKLAPPVMLAQLIQRVTEVYSDTLEDAKRNIRRSDKARASYYKHISGKRWGDAKNYELTINASVGIEKSSETILRYIIK